MITLVTSADIVSKRPKVFAFRSKYPRFGSVVLSPLSNTEGVLLADFDMENS